MKKILTSTLAMFLALAMVFTGPLRVFADNAQKLYISEVKIGMGDSARADLEAEGFTVLCDDKGNPVDLNQGAGGGVGSHGEKKVLFGYKTTSKLSEAITDLAVMNMNGGYSVQEYEALMEKYINAQIIPFIERFLVTIREYRQNVKSEDEQNRARAEYVRAALNKFTDDDCGGAPLGDLLLNDTRYELGDAAYDRLTAEEKNKHCDIVTLFAQADGQVMLTIFALLTRAADTSDDSWIDRFAGMTYDDIIDSYDLPYTDAKARAAKDFEDDAMIILKNWEEFRTFLMEADDNAGTLGSTQVPDADDVEAKIDALNDKASAEQVIDALSDLYDVQAQQTEMVEMAASAAAADFLENYEYGDGGTLYDFFTMSAGELADDITMLFPLIASLSPGQRAGLEFLSIREFVMIADRETEYSTDYLADTQAVSAFEGIDRAIYAKGGVAMTSDAMRTDALSKDKNLAERSKISTKTIVCWAVTGATALGFLGSVIGYGVRSAQLSAAKESLQVLQTKLKNLNAKYSQLSNNLDSAIDYSGYSKQVDRLSSKISKTEASIKGLSASTNTAKWMAAGFAAVTVLIAAVTTYMTWQDLKNYYKVDFTPIPHYMVDEASITYTNSKNEKLVKENHAAYYAAVKCYRTSSDGFGGKRYEMTGDLADLNGDVGQQWLALYACRDYNKMQPILADSLLAVVGSSEIPTTYDNRGIHMFGRESAFNLNSKLYDWNQNARSVFVYFKVDTSVTPGEAPTSGSTFSAGWIALVSVGCAALGAVVAAVAMTAYGKKKNNAAEA